jgi:Leucine-rich repeat (LRR) protein
MIATAKPRVPGIATSKVRPISKDPMTKSVHVKTEDAAATVKMTSKDSMTKSVVQAKIEEAAPVKLVASPRSKNMMSKSLHGSLGNGVPPTSPKVVKAPRSSRGAPVPASRTTSRPPTNGKLAATAPKKVEIAETKPEAKSGGPTTKPKRPTVGKPRTTAVFHCEPEEDEEEEETEVLHPAILKQTRQTGSLNLAGRELKAIPAKIWTLNDDGEQGQKKGGGLFMDKVDEDNWWERVDLTKLILASNQISKVSPKIKHLLSLTILDLHDNNISILPDEIGQLENLQKINLSHNKLTFLPLGFFDLTNLKSLNICHNEINEIHDDLGKLDMLEFVDLAFNKLLELPSLSLAGLSKVVNFTANNNMLESIPHELSFLRSVNCLELSHNNLADVPDSIQELHSLERLYLQHNKIKAMPNLSNCSNLKEVHLGFNNIEELTDMDIENMPNVKLLDLRDNKIPVLPDEIINLQCLERLDLSNNDLSTLPFTLGTLPLLKSLQVDGNPMRSIRRDIIARGTNGLLKYLKSRIDDDELNRLREKGNVSPVPLGFGSPPIPDKYMMKSAQVMNLSKKEMTALPKEAVENALEAEVTSVDLSQNYLDKFPTNLEPLMGQLYELNVASNRLESLPPSIIGLGVGLQYINLANNKLASLPPEIGLLSNLREVCLNCNRFDSIPMSLFGCAKLETLMMSDNRITTIDVDSLKRLNKLAILDVANNNIGSVPPELGLLTHIRSLQLDGNAFRVPRPQILVKGTETIMAYLRDRIPRSIETDQQPLQPQPQK